MTSSICDFICIINQFINQFMILIFSICISGSFSSAQIVFKELTSCFRHLCIFFLRFRRPFNRSIDFSKRQPASTVLNGFISNVLSLSCLLRMPMWARKPNLIARNARHGKSIDRTLCRSEKRCDDIEMSQEK